MRIIKIYSKSTATHILPGSILAKKARTLGFQNLLRCGDIQNKRVLDFGCGTGALADYIDSLGIECEYFGYDFVSEFEETVSQKFPWTNFVDRAYLENNEFDYIFVSGVFNNSIEDNVGFYQETLKELFASTKYCLSFNMMSAYVDYEDAGLFYEKPENVFNFCKSNLTPFVSLLNDYQLRPGAVPFEFACFLYKK